MNAHLTKRERQQLERAQTLLQRYIERRGKAEGVDLDTDPVDCDGALWSAKVADTRIEMLLDEDAADKRHAEALGADAMMEAALIDLVRRQIKSRLLSRPEQPREGRPKPAKEKAETLAGRLNQPLTLNRVRLRG